MTDFDRDFVSILEFLKGQRRRKLTLSFGRGILYLVGFLVLTFSIAALLDVLFQFEEAVRLGIVVAVELVAAVIFLKMILWPLFNFISGKGTFSNEKIAEELGGEYKKLHDELLNSLQIYRGAKSNHEHYSIDLVANAVRKTLARLKKLDFSQIYSLRRARGTAKLFAAPVLLSATALVMLPQSFREGLNHMLHPATRFKPVAVEFLSIFPGDVTIVEGDSLQIKAEIEGVFDGTVEISVQKENTNAIETFPMERDSSGVYDFQMKNVKINTHYFVRAKDEFSPVYRIDIQKRPFVRDLRVQLIFPGYTGMASRFLEDNVGDIIALKGTRAKIRASVNKPIQKASLIVGGKESKEFEISGSEVRTEIVVNKEQTYKISLLDYHGYENKDPIEYSIRPLPDQYPLVEITLPGRDVDLSEELKLPLSIEAEDDFGFKDLRLAYRIESSLPTSMQEDTLFKFINLTLPNQSDTKLNVDYLWDLAELSLMPEDLVYYYAEISDNDRVSGPKKSISRIYTARFPSVYEIYDEVANSQEEDLGNLEDVLSEGKELKEKLEEIARELKQQDQINWLKKQDMEDLAEKQQGLQKNVEEISQNLQEMIDRLESNQMLSFETLEKYQELQKLFQEMMTPELQRALEKMRESFEQLDPNKLRQAVSQLQSSQEKLMKNLERTVNLLKQMQLEQNLDQATKLLDDLEQRQDRLNEEIAKKDQEKRPNLLHQQQKLEEDAQSLNDMISSLEKELEKEASFSSEIQDSLSQEMQEVLQNMQMTQEQLRQDQMAKAGETGENAEQGLNNMKGMMQDLKESFTQSKKQEFMEQFSRNSEDLLRLSKAQEDLLQQTKELSSTSPQIGQTAETQQQLLQQMGRITNQLYELSQETFFVTPEIGRSMGKSMSGMQNALKNLAERNPSNASRQQSNAMGGLNETILEIANAMQGLQGASSASGLDEFMKQLQQMSGAQQGINQETIKLGMEGKMSPEQQGAMARLAAQQEALRKSLEQLQQEFGNQSEILGRMDGVAKDMEDVVKDFQRQQVEPKTFERQKRIMSRLLDAQRSMREREYSKKREAESGKTYFVRSPEEVGEKIRQQKDRFLEDLLRARKAGYNEDYLELIRDYFQAITDRGVREKSVSN